jgi:hypothetical protein
VLFIYKKNIALLAMVMSINSSCFAFGQEASQGYQTNQGYPADQGGYPSQHHHSNDRARAADERRLEALEKEDAEAYAHSKIAFVGVVIGGIVTYLAIRNRDEEIYEKGAIFTVMCGAICWIARNGENDRAIARKNEKKYIQDRLNHHHHH